MKPILPVAEQPLWHAVVGRRAALRFVVLFVGALAVYFLLSASISFRDPAEANQRPVVALVVAANAAAQRAVLVPYQEFLARCTGGLVTLFGSEIAVVGREIRSCDFAVSIASGCDAMELMLLLSAAITTFPAGWCRKIVGLVAGVLAIAGLNLVRICSLWFIGIHWPGGFDFAHFGVWPFLLTCGTIAVFLLWLRFGVHTSGVLRLST